eukprot:gene16315-19930_t
MVPGMVTFYWLTPTRTGTFEVLCAELCGVGHPQMRGTVVVDSAEDYQTWLTSQQTFSQLMAAAQTKETAQAGNAAPARALGPAEVEDVELYHPHSWWTRYVFSQDAKIIAVQYASTAIAIGMVALVLSWLMRLQLGFPGAFAFIDAERYYQFITMHGMIMVIYLLTALFLGGFGNYLI